MERAVALVATALSVGVVMLVIDRDRITQGR
jgi:hypothetical protein